jgi:4'-phosphopantetheinyl transferase
MQTTLGQDVASIAASLGNDSIHVWQLAYRRAMQRDPLRALLAVYLGVPAATVAFADDAYGRPELAAPWHGLLRFNWSHSGDRALIAVARDVAPGVDLEHIRPRPRAMALAERFFHHAETAALSALDGTQREHAFLELWTGKEAVLKALGRGLAFGLERLQLSTTAPARLLWLDGDDPAQWQLHRLDVGAGYLASLAWRGSARSIGLWTLAGEP